MVGMDGSDGQFIPGASVTLEPGDNGYFDFSDVIVNADVLIDFVDGDYGREIGIYSTGDIYIGGTIDALGYDLTIWSGGVNK